MRKRAPWLSVMLARASSVLNALARARRTLAAKARRTARERRLRKAGFEEVSDEQRASLLEELEFWKADG